MCRAFRPSAMLPRRRLRFIQKCTLFYSELRAGSPSRKPTPLCCTRFRAPMSQRYVPQFKANDLTARENFVRQSIWFHSIPYRSSTYPRRTPHLDQVTSGSVPRMQGRSLAGNAPEI